MTEMKRQPSPLVSAEQFERALSTLPEREQHIFTARYGLAAEPATTHKSLAKHHGLSEIRIRQIERLAVRKMAHPERGVHIPPLDQIPEPDY